MFGFFPARHASVRVRKVFLLLTCVLMYMFVGSPSLVTLIAFPHNPERDNDENFEQAESVRIAVFYFIPVLYRKMLLLIQFKIYFLLDSTPHNLRR